MKPSKAHDSVFYHQTLKIIRVNGVLLPFVVVAAGLLIKFGVLSQAAYLSDMWFVAVSAGFVSIAAVYYATPHLTPNQYFAYSIIYHLLAVLFLVCVSGVFSPFVIFWLILFVGLDNYFGGRSILFSLAWLLLAGVLDIVLHPAYTGTQQVAIGLTVLFMAGVCATMAQLRGVNDRERIDLANSHDREAFERDRLITLVNSISDSVVSTNEKGIIRVYNAATLGLLDTHIALNNKQLNRYVRLYDEAGKRVDILAAARRTQSSFVREDLLMRFENETINVSVSVSPIRLNYRTRGEQGYIFIMRDITKQKTLEEERDEFISVVSHELRTPIAIAEGNVSNVRLLRSKGLPEATVDHALDETHEQIMYLAKMINDLSTLSRAERGLDAPAETITLSDLMNDMYHKYEPRAAEKGLHFNLDIAASLPILTTSRLYLEEVLQNFITNAIKYTKTGSIVLSAAVVKNELRISVKDTGIGISKADQKHIFEKFYRSEDYRTRESNGTGLGLYVARKLATKLNATLEFTSRLNHGSTFALVIPLPKNKKD